MPEIFIMRHVETTQPMDLSFLITTKLLTLGRGRSCAVTMPTKSADRRGRSCAGPQIMSQPFFKNKSNIVCRPVQDRPLHAADLAGSNYQLSELGK